MNTLLPKSESEFSEVNYWERFFKNRSKSFDWYGEYISLVELFSKYVKTDDSVLVVGCGNSTLSYDLYTRQKCSKVCSIDISNNAIEQMLKKHEKIICKITDKKKKAFDFKCCDVCKFSEDEDIKKLLPITCIIDKGTTDAIHSGGSSSESIITNMWSEIERNLAVMGRYVLITLAQSHIVESIKEFFLKPNQNQWMINVHEISSSNFTDKSFCLPVFAFVFYKMKSSPSLPLVYVEENSFSKTSLQAKNDKKLLKNSVEQLGEWISSRQQLAILSHSMQESKKSESVINMVSSSSGLVRYHCILVRNESLVKKKMSDQLVYCVFIVPFGLNDSDIVNSKEARFKLCRDHLKSRVCLFVFLNAREHYETREKIQEELNSVAVKFCPEDVPANYMIPFVSCNDLVYKSSSLKVKDCFFESLETSGENYLRLISPSSKVAVVVANKPLTMRDRLVSNYIKLMPELVNGKRGVYYGRTSCCDFLNDRWKLVLPDIDPELLTMVQEKMNVDCINSGESLQGVDWVVYDSDVADKNVLQKLLLCLSDSGMALLCCHGADSLKMVVKDIQLSVTFSCETIEPFGGDKTSFALLSKRSSDISMLQKAFDNLSCE